MPLNLTEGAALLSLIGRLTGYPPRWFTYLIQGAIGLNGRGYGPHESPRPRWGPPSR
jgi:hypothetical protein